MTDISNPDGLSLDDISSALRMGPSEGAKCGFITLLGAPNAGKSTLVNQVVGSKVTIVSPKVQTTRTRVMGVTCVEKSQLVFIDTPGIFTPKRRLDRAMVNAAWDGTSESDVVLLLIDSAKKLNDETLNIIKKINKRNLDVVLVLNKVDLIHREKLLEISARLNEEATFKKTFMISAENGSGVQDLLKYLAGLVPESPWMFPEDQLSDMPMRLLAAEVTREQLYYQLHEELPYSTTVETEKWEQFDNGSIKISQVIYVQRDGQRGIILGHGGKKIKSIGTSARKELEQIFECQVHLKIFVKVRERWLDDPERYHMWGLDPNA